MTQDFEQIPGVSSAAIGKVGDEPTFPFPEVLQVIKACSANQIAVLGVELFLVKPDGYYAFGCSDYDLDERQKWPQVLPATWPDYVRYNNSQAEDCVRRNPLGDDHVYILTTASWNEFRKIQEMKPK